MSIKAFYIIPVFNCENTIVRCLKSILSIKYNISVIIINDKSIDNTLTVIDSIKEELPYEIFIINNRTNLGITKSLNNGIEMALKYNADYILRLDGDDYNAENRTDYQIEYMELNKHLILLTTNAFLLKDNIIKNSIVNNYKPFLEDYFRPYTSIISSLDIHPTFIFRTEPFVKYEIRYGNLPNQIFNSELIKTIKYGIEDLLLINIILYFYGYSSVTRISHEKLIYYSVNNNGLTPKSRKDHSQALNKIINSAFVLYTQTIPNKIKPKNIYALAKAITKKNYNLNPLCSNLQTIIGFIIISSRYNIKILTPVNVLILLIVSPRILIQKIKFLI